MRPTAVWPFSPAVANQCLRAASIAALHSRPHCRWLPAATRNAHAQGVWRTDTTHLHRTTATSPDHRVGLGMQRCGPRTDSLKVLSAPTPPGHPCPFSYRSPRRRSTPGCLRAAQTLRPKQAIEYRRQLTSVDMTMHHQFDLADTDLHRSGGRFAHRRHQRPHPLWHLTPRFGIEGHW